MTAIASLPHRALIRLTGPDWASFLKGLCTADIDVLAAEATEGRFSVLHYGAFLRPQGKMYADCLLHAVAADEIWLDVPLSAREELLAKLNMYKLRAKVTVEAADKPVSVAFGGPLPTDFLTDPRSKIIGASFGFIYESRTSSDSNWPAFRLAHGLSDPGTDFGADELYPIDANLDLLDAIDFHKGCYVGQELTSRMKRRGQIKNRLLPLKSQAELPKGMEILLGDRKVGEVIAAHGHQALGLMRLDRLTQVEVTCEDKSAEVLVPAWIAPHISLGEIT
ncbi:MAG TPA: folate-binding protein [Asticcacaulis sp.]|nr:folate-binding protein [Asticcacaulis sp.]